MSEYDIRLIVAKNLKALRKRKGLSIQKFADKVNIDRRKYSKIEKGLSDLTVSESVGIKEVFDISIDELASKDGVGVYASRTEAEIARALKYFKDLGVKVKEDDLFLVHSLHGHQINGVYVPDEYVLELYKDVQKAVDEEINSPLARKLLTKHYAEELVQTLKYREN